MDIKKFIHECVYGVPLEREVTKFRCDFVTQGEDADVAWIDTVKFEDEGEDKNEN